MPTNKKPRSTENKSISISGDVKDSVVISGDNNTVNQTIIQKFFNIFKSDSETLEQRNRRILLGHVENAWIKGVLDASLHGAALLDLGIKQDPEAVTKYPWAIKKESTNETLPAGTSMLEIFDSIGLGRSLLILGAPGSGKTTMLLELARQLIQHAREDVTYPIPMVFNLSSWTESKNLTDWLAQELNNLYSVPRKTAPNWVKGDKLLLLLDGLDEVRPESRAKCVEAINAFRKEHGLTSLAVCSRSQDYADLNAKLSFEGAIEVQPLKQEQITEFFDRFGEEMAGIKQALEKDNALREMAETPLFLSIMILAYRDKQDIDILVSNNKKAQRKHLFDTYIERMFERPRFSIYKFKKQDISQWLSWLAKNMKNVGQTIFLIEWMQPNWLPDHQFVQYLKISQYTQLTYFNLVTSTFLGLLAGFGGGWQVGLSIGVLSFFLFILYFYIVANSQRDVRRVMQNRFTNIEPMEVVRWSWRNFLFRDHSFINSEEDEKERLSPTAITITMLFSSLFSGGICSFATYLTSKYFLEKSDPSIAITTGVGMASLIMFTYVFSAGLDISSMEKHTHPNQGIWQTAGNALTIGATISIGFSLICGLLWGIKAGIIISGIVFLIGIGFGGGSIVIQHLFLRIFLWKNNYMALKMVPFLDHCVDLIFLRRVGGGYIFVHRLLMEHFAEMYVETPTSKGN